MIPLVIRLDINLFTLNILNFEFHTCINTRNMCTKCISIWPRQKSVRWWQLKLYMVFHTLFKIYNFWWNSSQSIYNLGWWWRGVSLAHILTSLPVRWYLICTSVGQLIGNINVGFMAFCNDNMACRLPSWVRQGGGQIVVSASWHSIFYFVSVVAPSVWSVGLAWNDGHLINFLRECISSSIMNIAF